MVETSKSRRLASAVDPIVLSSGLVRLVATITGPITALLILNFLSLAEQGYWYTFLGLVTIVNYAELGMGQVIMQFAAHEWVAWNETGEIPNSINAYRLKSILRTAMLLGGLTALADFVVILPLGYFVMSGKDGVDQLVQWLGPWALVSIVAPLNLALAFLNSFLEGCQMIVTANLRRSSQAIAQIVVTCLVFFYGGKLWALGAGQVANLLTGVIWILFAQGGFIRQMLAGFLKNTEVSWRKEIWPLQWRYAASWAAGPLTYGLFNPLIFTLAGSEAAGRFGFTFSMVGVVSAYAQVWVASRAAVFTRLNAGARWNELRSLFARSVKHSAMTYALGALALLVALYVANQRFPSLAARLLDPLSTALLLIASGMTLAVFFVTYFARSFREEPFVKMAWINALLMVTLLPIGIILFQTKGASGAYLISQAAILPISWQIYKRYHQRTLVQSEQTL